MKILVGVMLAGALLAQQPVFKGDKLARPENYREWIFLSSGLGMTYSGEPDHREPAFDNVFVSPEAYRSFVKTGAWPEKTIFILEVRDSATNGSINKGGHYQSDNFRLSAEVKDSSRFKDKWEYFAFPSTGEPAEALPRVGRLLRVPLGSTEQWKTHSSSSTRRCFRWRSRRGR